MDKDIICISSPIDKLREQIKLIGESDYLISSKTETFIDDNFDDENFRLDLKSKIF